MSAKSELEPASRQCAFIHRLIVEAEACSEKDRADLIFGMAREESGNLAKTLTTLLARKRLAHQLPPATAA